MPTAAPTISSKPRRKMSEGALALLVMSGVAFAGWVAPGITASNLSEVRSAADKSQTTADGRIETLQSKSKSASLKRHLDDMTQARDEFEDASDDVAALEKSVAQRELTVTGREEAIAAKETRIQATTLKDGQYYTVGVSMAAGTYQATSASGR